MTFNRRPTRHRPTRIVALLLLASIDGCADMPAARLADTSPAPYGIIVSVRPVTASHGDMRGVILSAIGTAALAPRDDRVEIIVRQEDGQAISLVRPDTGKFRAGERILLTRGATTQIARPGN